MYLQPYPSHSLSFQGSTPKVRPHSYTAFQLKQVFKVLKTIGFEQRKYSENHGRGSLKKLEFIPPTDSIFPNSMHFFNDTRLLSQSQFQQLRDYLDIETEELNTLLQTQGQDVPQSLKQKLQGNRQML